MATPGDKAGDSRQQKVVQLDPDESARETTSPAHSQPQPSTSTAAEMGHLTHRLPQFESSFTDVQPSSGAATKPEAFQAHIEDYFTQTKYYPSVSEIPYQQKSIEQPGPSGLQAQRKRQRSSTTGKRPTQLQRKSHSCSVCHKNFATADKLSKHQQTHTGSSPFKCEHCKKSFSSKFKLVRHVLIHSDRKPFSCTVCERTFHRKDHLKNHIKVHSPSKKIYVCEKSDCKKEYTSLMSYKKHLALHAAEEGCLQCQICQSTFATKDEILYHLKIHAGSRTVKNPNEKKFTCDECHRKFFTKKDVRRHMVVHTGMRDFLCQFCPQRFGRKDHLVRHIKKSHSKNIPPEELDTVIKTEPGMVSVKTETVVKSEFSESSSMSTSTEPFEFSLVDVRNILQQDSFDTLTPFLETDVESEFLPSTSSQIELKDLGSTILEEIGEDVPDEGLLGQSELLPNPELQRLLEPSEEKNLPLPGFSQTFQPPPQPPP